MVQNVGMENCFLKSFANLALLSILLHTHSRLLPCHDDDRLSESVVYVMTLVKIQRGQLDENQEKQSVGGK